MMQARNAGLSGKPLGAPLCRQTKGVILSMFTQLSVPRFAGIRGAAAKLVAGLSLLWLAACDLPPVATGGATGPQVTAGEPVQVALLLPRGESDSEMNLIATSLENATRMAIADLQGVQVDLRVYNTGRDPQRAAAMATRAVSEGAKIILGPLDAQSANAAGVAVAPAGVNVLAFSNNPSIAGGNVFILGRTFDSVADRLVRYSAQNGTRSFLVVHQDDLGGAAGRDAIVAAAQRNGATVTGVQSYPFSQQGIFDRAGTIMSAVSSTGAQAVFVTDTAAGGLPILATALADRGLSTSETPLVGLSAWDSTRQALDLPGLQNGYFARPDSGLEGQFNARYQAAYGGAPHPLASIAYDGMAAVGALAASGDRTPFSRAAITRRSGFAGATGIFRFRADGSNDRALAVARIQDNRVVVVDPAPRSFGAAGS